MLPSPSSSTLFPYTTLFRSRARPSRCPSSPISSPWPTRPRRTRSSTSSRTAAGSTPSTSANPSTPCAPNSTNTAGGSHPGSIRCAGTGASYPSPARTGSSPPSPRSPMPPVGSWTPRPTAPVISSSASARTRCCHLPCRGLGERPMPVTVPRARPTPTDRPELPELPARPVSAHSSTPPTTSTTARPCSNPGRSRQSAAEIYRDLIDDAEDRGVRLDWVTRSPRFFPMEYTKLTLEMTSPEYTDHFRALPDELRDRVGREQRTLYKGISADLVDDIHDALYRLSRGGRPLLTSLISEAELQAATVDPISGEYLLDFRNTALDKTFTRRSGAVVAATGYRSQVPDFLTPLGDEVHLDAHGRLDVSRHYTINDEGTIHVLNGEEHTHGVTAPDLGFGPWRASVVLARVTGREPYPIENRIALQTFGVPDDDPAAALDLDDSKEMSHA